MTLGAIPRNRPRIHLILLAYLTLGAAINIVIALAGSTHKSTNGNYKFLRIHEGAPVPWPAPVPGDWPQFTSSNHGVFRQTTRSLARHDVALAIEDRRWVNYIFLYDLQGPADRPHEWRNYNCARSRVGFPLATLQWSVHMDQKHASGGPIRQRKGCLTLQEGPPLSAVRVLPYAPLWPGVIVNTVFYALCLYLSLFFISTTRRRRREDKGLCPNCAYDLQSHYTAGCPECGWNRDSHTTPAHPNPIHAKLPP